MIATALLKSVPKAGRTIERESADVADVADENK
jgi:hypothetical protein